MSTEVVKTGGELERHEPSMMEVLSRAAADPKVDVAKLQALLDMQERIQRREAEVEFNAALARLMPMLPRIEKDGIIRDKSGAIRSKYARYETIDLIIRPLLAEEGFSISFDTEDSTAGFIRVTGTLAHRMGHSRQSKITVPTSSQVITGAQAVGSAVSFCKRYICVNLLNIVTCEEDNDGQGDPSTISADQLLTIETMLQDFKADRGKFLRWAGVEKLENILAKDYATVIKTIQAKGRQQ